MKKISLIVPCYYEEEALPHFYKEANAVSEELKDYVFEFVFVDDGSKDKTLSIIKELAEKDSRVRYTSFSRNFGKEAAMYAGLKMSTGDYIATMDADLQDPPSLLPDMLKAIEQDGYDCAATRRVTRKGEPPIRSFFARVFYKLMGSISKTEFVDGARDFRLMKRKMVEAVLSMCEYNRFSKGIYGWVGFETKWFEYENIERVAGETKWSFWKLLAYSIEGIIAFSTAPLALASLIGVLFCVFSFVMICFIIAKTLIWGDPVGGYPSLICVIFLIGGIQLFSIGVLGQYLSKTYLETKRRPIYIVKETNSEELEEK